MNRENEIINVRVDEIIPNRFQPRLSFNEAELKELSDSIKVHGIIQPLVLRRINDKFEIIAGERRYKAAVMAGLSAVPAIIMNIDDKQSAEVAVVENLQRKDLSAIEEAQSYKKLLDMGYLTQEELAAKMGVAQPTIANKLRLLSLPEPVQQALLKNQISERHARSLLQIPDAGLQVNMLNRIINERLTVRQTDDEISKILGRPIAPVQPVAPVPPIVPTTPVTNEPNQNIASPVTNGAAPNPTMNRQPEAPKPFDVDINKIKNESQDIIKEHVPSDIDMLLRTEKENTEQTGEDSGNKKISLEDTVANVDMGNLVNPSKLSINPFQEMNPEVMNFEVPATNSPTTVSPTPTNSLIEEFKQQPGVSYQATPIPTPPTANTNGISKAINVAREEARKIEQLGFEVDTEEFDFEDMYQIIIKIKKD